MSGDHTGSRTSGLSDFNLVTLPSLKLSVQWDPIYKSVHPTQDHFLCLAIPSHLPHLSPGPGKADHLEMTPWVLSDTGTKGNLCQRKMPLSISVALTFPSAMMASYYLLLQTYVLRLEAIMNGILLFFCGSELLLEVLTLAAFSRYCFAEGPFLITRGLGSHPREGFSILLKPKGSRRLFSSGGKGWLVDCLSCLG